MTGLVEKRRESQYVRASLRATCRIAPFVPALVAFACADLAPTADQIPSSMSLAPFDTLVTVGHEFGIRVTVEDQDGKPMAGPPSWARPVWSLSDSGSVSVERDGSATALRGGYVALTAKVAGLEAWMRLRANPVNVTLRAPSIYLTQAAQNVDGSVPLVAGRRALLRVFMTGHETSFYTPQARATFYHGDEAVHVATIATTGVLIPTTVEEERLDRSFNAVVPGWVLQPGVEMVVELDPENAAPTSPSSQLRVPAQGRTRLDVRALPTLEQTIVPVLVASDPNRQVFNWTQGMTAESRHMQLARALMPIGDMNVTVRDPYTTSSDLTKRSGWQGFLQEITALWTIEGEIGYYYGVVVLPRGSAWGGLGWIGVPVSVGRPSDNTFAHELGHNMGLLHAPCGGAGAPDARYPHDGGDIGVWGYDFRDRRLVHPSQYKDLMGYCDPSWVSDYHFEKALGYRMREAPPSQGPFRTAAATESTLLLWGSADAGDYRLDPAFLIDARPDVPDPTGRYRLDGFADGGRRAFSFPFEPGRVEHGGRQFVLAVPYDPVRDGVLERVVLTGPEGEAALEASGSIPMAIVRNRGDGRVRAILRDWTGASDGSGASGSGASGATGTSGASAVSALLAEDVEVVVSHGLPGGDR